MWDSVLEMVSTYPGMLVFGTPVVLIICAVWYFGADRIFGSPMQVYVADGESDDDDVYVVPQSHETRLHLAEANQEGEDHDAFRN